MRVSSWVSRWARAQLARSRAAIVAILETRSLMPPRYSASQSLLPPAYGVGGRRVAELSAGDRGNHIGEVQVAVIRPSCPRPAPRRARRRPLELGAQARGRRFHWM